jgi:hypothetical protein
VGTHELDASWLIADPGKTETLVSPSLDEEGFTMAFEPIRAHAPRMNCDH